MIISLSPNTQWQRPPVPAGSGHMLNGRGDLEPHGSRERGCPLAARQRHRVWFEVVLSS